MCLYVRVCLCMHVIYVCTCVLGVYMCVNVCVCRDVRKLKIHELEIVWKCTILLNYSYIFYNEIKIKRSNQTVPR